MAVHQIGQPAPVNRPAAGAPQGANPHQVARLLLQQQRIELPFHHHRHGMVAQPVGPKQPRAAAFHLEVLGQPVKAPEIELPHLPIHDPGNAHTGGQKNALLFRRARFQAPIVQFFKAVMRVVAKRKALDHLAIQPPPVKIPAARLPLGGPQNILPCGNPGLRPDLPDFGGRVVVVGRGRHRPAQGRNAKPRRRGLLAVLRAPFLFPPAPLAAKAKPMRVCCIHAQRGIFIEVKRAVPEKPFAMLTPGRAQISLDQFDQTLSDCHSCSFLNRSSLKGLCYTCYATLHATNSHNDPTVA